MNQSYVIPGGNADGGDPYTGLDRFGRVLEQRWVKTSTGFGTGVVGDSPSGAGVLGQSQSDIAVRGISVNGLGMQGQSTTNTGVLGTSEGQYISLKPKGGKSRQESSDLAYCQKKERLQQGAFDVQITGNGRR